MYSRSKFHHHLHQCWLFLSQEGERPAGERSHGRSAGGAAALLGLFSRNAVEHSSVEVKRQTLCQSFARLVVVVEIREGSRVDGTIFNILVIVS